MPLLVAEEASSAMRDLYRADSGIIVWWGTEVEVTSALARRERAGDLSTDLATEALQRWAALEYSMHEIGPSEAVRTTARRFLRVHDLRAADALQLSAAFVAAETRPSTLEVVCLDDRLSTAAKKEGFTILGSAK